MPRKRKRSVPAPAPPPEAQAPGGPAPAEPEAERLLGPPPREALLEPSDSERRARAELERHHGTGPELTGGDVDADWQRASSVGEEGVGGTVATPDQSVVDDLGQALGVPRDPAAEVRTSAEILEERDRRRAHEPE